MRIEGQDRQTFCPSDKHLSKKIKNQKSKIKRTNSIIASHSLVQYSCHIATVTTSNIFMWSNYWPTIKSITKMISPIIHMKIRKFIRTKDTMNVINVVGSHVFEKIEKFKLSKLFFLLKKKDQKTTARGGSTFSRP
jgi:hypothetical protein